MQNRQRTLGFRAGESKILGKQLHLRAETLSLESAHVSLARTSQSTSGLAQRKTTTISRSLGMPYHQGVVVSLALA